MRKLTTALLTALLCITLSACTATAENAAVSSTSTQSTSSASATAPQKSTVTTTTASSGSALDISSIFSDRDLQQSVDTTTATTITVQDNNTVTIDAEGTYILTGTASNATILINAADTDKVQLVLDNLNVTNNGTPVIEILSGDKVFINLAAGSANTLKVTGDFADDDEEYDAVIFSKSDLTINGSGTLNIESSENGISGHDDLTLTGGAYNITTEEDAIEGHDSIAVYDGTYTINAGKDAFHSEDDDDDTVGYLYVCGGTFDITAGDDGLQATTIGQFDGGTFTINADEGIEATSLQFNDGIFTITASDDGINASDKSRAYDIAIEINGGTFNIMMGSGDTDAIDSNGSLTINGGTLNITAQSAFDYETSGVINGGDITVNGETVTTMTNSMGGGMGKGGGRMNPPAGRDTDTDSSATADRGTPPQKSENQDTDASSSATTQNS